MREIEAAVESVKIPKKHDFEPQVVEQLVKSLAERGLDRPIVVQDRADRLVLIIGANRLEAAKRLGWKTISALVIATNSDWIEAAKIPGFWIESAKLLGWKRRCATP